MKQELPQGAVFGIIGVVVVGLIVGAFMFFRGGPGAMTSEDIKRAQMEAEVGNQRMRGYIGNSGAPGGGGAPGSADSSPEAAARAKHAAGQK